MKENVLKFKRPDTESIYERANISCDNGDYASALSSLAYESEKHPENADIHAHIADIYTELGLFENAVFQWFIYLSKSRKKYYIDGYNGLGANYYFLDNKILAGYYFKKQTECGDDTDCVYQDVFEDYIADMTDDIRNSYRVVKSGTREEKDEEILGKAQDLNDDNDHKGALETLGGILPDSPVYARAASEKARAEFFLGDDAATAEYAETAIEHGDNDPYTYAIGLSSLECLGREEDFKEFYGKFRKERYSEPSDVYKQLGTMCDFGFEKDAAALADEILSVNPNDANVCFIKGILSYNFGDRNSARSFLSKSYILSGSPIAKYYSAEVAAGTEDRFPVVFDLPERETEERLNIIKSIFEENESIENYSEKRLLDVAEWIFAGNNQSLQTVVGILFILRSDNEKFLGFILKQLLSPVISDEVKHKFLSMLCERGYNERVSVVYANIFKKVKIPAPEFAEENGKLFGQAFAFAFGRLSLVRDGGFEKFAEKAAEFQKEFLKKSSIEKIKSIPALACAMYLYSDTNYVKETMSYGFFSADEKEVKELLLSVIDGDRE
ncbi:MAG TPA: hypothetical protein DDW54_01130 [Clostridiales bacterium]|nr:hypothetical protein [Clostridiales bacterium]